VKIRGTKGETEEHHCVADFTQYGHDVTCKVNDIKNVGDIECIIWRTTTTNGWAFDKVIHLIIHNFYKDHSHVTSRD
jgi:hypothetical protein